MRFFNQTRGSVWNLIPFAVGLVFFLLAAVGIQNLAGHSQEESRKLLEKNLRYAAVECYAVEGRYPGSISYIQENYDIYVDEKRYAVHYEYVGENLAPDITVIVLEP